MRYRLIDVRLWCDQKFQKLSPIPPCGQGLFLYLLTNPNTTAIPGLYRAGAAALAEELGWPLEAFQKAFQELLDQGLIKADLKARLIFIPNAIKYNKPQSPNVVISWDTHWDELPECELKTLAYQALREFVTSLGEGYAKAFAKAIGKPFGKTMPNQEQEQEQEQEQDLLLGVGNKFPPPSVDSKAADDEEDAVEISKDEDMPPCPYGKIVELYHEILPTLNRVKVENETRRKHLRQRWRDSEKHRSLDFWRNYFEFVKKSDFLMGKVSKNGQRPFLADFEWLIRPTNFAKVIEGKYVNR